jgi:hypothetical protein
LEIPIRNGTCISITHVKSANFILAKVSEYFPEAQKLKLPDSNFLKLDYLDRFAITLAKNAEKLVDALLRVPPNMNLPLIDIFWKFFLQDAPDHFLVRPDDYNYNRNLIHQPFWITLLATRLEIPPPGIQVTKNHIIEK